MDMLPPNVSLLSDNVIGDVVQRSREASKVHLISPSSHEPIQSELYDAAARCIPAGKSRPELLPERKEQEPSPKLHTDERDSLAEELEAKKYQRELRRMRQLRYRKKKDRILAALDRDNHQLRIEIRVLEQRSHTIHSSIPTQESVWKAASSYFHMYRRGYQPTTDSTKPGFKRPEDQFDFAQAAMAPDVKYNTVRGVKALMAVWRRFSLWFQDVELVLESLEQDTSESVVASLTASFTFSASTLHNVFPNLLLDGGDGDESSSKKASIANKVLGERVVMRGTTRFEWDCIFGRISSISDNFDLLTPILHLLGNLEHVAVLFEKSRARLDFRPSDLVHDDIEWQE